MSPDPYLGLVVLSTSTWREKVQVHPSRSDSWRRELKSLRWNWRAEHREGARSFDKVDVTTLHYSVKALATYILISLPFHGFTDDPLCLQRFSM